MERFPDKRHPQINFDDAVDYIKDTQERSSKVEVAQEHATWLCNGEYPHIPVGITFLTDIHFGSKGVDYDLLQDHINTVMNTPNMFALMGGDLIDAFSAVKHPKAMQSDAMSPDEQVESMMDLLMKMDQASKLGAVQTGNHDDWSDLAGYRFERFLRELQCPVFNGAGEIDIFVNGGEKYPVWWSHTHWGNSKLNITNAPKRAMQFSSERAEISLVGHVHQASAEQFDIAGKRKIAVVGGTYKLHDSYGRKWGMGQAGQPGYTLLLWPDTHRLEVVREPEMAKEYIINAIRNAEEHGYEDPYSEMIRRLNYEQEQRELRRSSQSE